MSKGKLVSYILILVLGAAALVFSILETSSGASSMVTGIIKIVLSLLFVGYGAFGVIKYVKEKNE